MSPALDLVPVAANGAGAASPALLTGLSPLVSHAAAEREGGDAANPWRRIYVGELTRVSPHPNADREVVVEVDAGWSRLTVVTGGPHVEVGRKVAVALPGARVVDAGSPAPRMRKLKKGRIRGVMSEAMLCSAKELGLSDDHSSIYQLAADAPVGAALADWLRA
jgi:phenylalanyl-tRNA synthetase beta chain